MYVLTVEFLKTAMTIKAPSVGGCIAEIGSPIEQIVWAVSEDSSALESEAVKIKDKFSSTYYWHRIWEVKEV